MVPQRIHLAVVYHDGYEQRAVRSKGIISVRRYGPILAPGQMQANKKKKQKAEATLEHSIRPHRDVTRAPLILNSS